MSKRRKVMKMSAGMRMMKPPPASSLDHNRPYFTEEPDRRILALSSAITS